MGLGLYQNDCKVGETEIGLLDLKLIWGLRICAFGTQILENVYKFFSVTNTIYFLYMFPRYTFFCSLEISTVHICVKEDSAWC